MRAARAQKDVDKADKRETDAVRKAKDEAAAAEAQRTGKEERERLQNKPYDPEPPQTTVGTKRKEPKPQTEEERLRELIRVQEKARRMMLRSSPQNARLACSTKLSSRLSVWRAVLSAPTLRTRSVPSTIQQCR